MTANASVDASMPVLVQEPECVPVSIWSENRLSFMSVWLIYQHYNGIDYFSNTIIPLALAGYEMIIAGHLISNVRICGKIVKYTNLSVVNHIRQEVKTAAARQAFM